MKNLWKTRDFWGQNLIPRRITRRTTLGIKRLFAGLFSVILGVRRYPWHLTRLGISGWSDGRSSYILFWLIVRSNSFSGGTYEAYIPAQSSQACQDPRFPQEDEDRGRPQGSCLSSASGAQEAHSLGCGAAQGYSSYRLSRVREGIQEGHGVQGEAIFGSRFSRQLRQRQVRVVGFEEGWQRRTAQRCKAQVAGDIQVEAAGYTGADGFRRFRASRGG